MEALSLEQILALMKKYRISQLATNEYGYTIHREPDPLQPPPKKKPNLQASDPETQALDELMMTLKEPDQR